MALFHSMHPRERDILSPDEILQLTALEQGHKLCKREAAFYGFCAGVLACTASTPIRHAAFGASSLFRIPAFVRDTARSTGILSLWRGNSTACVMIGPKCAVRYAVYNSVMSYLSDEETPTTLHRVIAGTLASTTAELAAFPFNVIRHRQRPGDGLFKTFSDIVNREGFHALGDGILRNAAVALPVDIVYHATLGGVVSALEGTSSALQSLGCAALATTLSTTITYPLEVVKRGVNSRNERGETVFQSVRQCFQHIAKEKGVGGFYEGLGTTLIARIPFVAVEVTFLEGVQRTIRHLQQRKIAKFMDEVRADRARKEEELQKAKVQSVRSWSWF